MSKSKYHCIGRGGCGSVWAVTAPTPTAIIPLSDPHDLNTSGSASPLFTLPKNHVLKREDMDEARSIANDMAMHRRLLDSTNNTKLPFLVPKSYCMLEPDDAIQSHLEFIPGERGRVKKDDEEGLRACRTYCQERIPPLPRPVREALIDRYCPEIRKESTRTSKADEDCLVRLYCGRRRTAEERARQKMFFTLRNYGATIDQLEELGIDIDGVVEVLAEALATCFWTAGIDANDSEFVFGLPPLSSSHKLDVEARSQFSETQRGPDARMAGARVFGFLGAEVMLWMLDFDCARYMPTNEQGVQQAVDAFWRNDPYFPRPWTNNYTNADRRSWELFKGKFLEESEKILRPKETVRDEWVDFARLWVDKVEEEGWRRAREGARNGEMASAGRWAEREAAEQRAG